MATKGCVQTIALFLVAGFDGLLQQRHGRDARLMFLDFTIREFALFTQRYNLLAKAVAAGILYLALKVGDVPVKRSKSRPLAVQGLLKAINANTKTLQLFLGPAPS